MASDERAQFRSRLCDSLVRGVLQQVEIELLEVKSLIVPIKTLPKT